MWTRGNPFVIVVCLVVWKIGGCFQPKYYLTQKLAARSQKPSKTNSLPIAIHHFWWVWGVSNYHRVHHIIKFTQPISTMTWTYPKTPHEERFPSTATDASRRFLSGIKSSVGPESFLDLRSKFQENTMRCFLWDFWCPKWQIHSF